MPVAVSFGASVPWSLENTAGIDTRPTRIHLFFISPCTKKTSRSIVAAKKQVQRAARAAAAAAAAAFERSTPGTEQTGRQTGRNETESQAEREADRQTERKQACRQTGTAVRRVGKTDRQEGSKTNRRAGPNRKKDRKEERQAASGSQSIDVSLAIRLSLTRARRGNVSSLSSNYFAVGPFPGPFYSMCTFD